MEVAKYLSASFSCSWRSWKVCSYVSRGISHNQSPRGIFQYLRVLVAALPRSCWTYAFWCPFERWFKWKSYFIFFPSLKFRTSKPTQGISWWILMTGLTTSLSKPSHQLTKGQLSRSTGGCAGKQAFTQISGLAKPTKERVIDLTVKGKYGYRSHSLCFSGMSLLWSSSCVLPHTLCSHCTIQLRVPALH